MEPVKRLYTLVDFAEDLDWKPLHFVKPLPRKRRCSVCMLVRKTTTVLPCGHVVCRCCYDGCEVEDEYVCPKDGKNFPGKVKWRRFPTRNMLRRKVKCWNEAHGCTAVMAASKVSVHFNRECQYHSTLCSRCSTMVLCSDMCEHLKSSCRELRGCKATESGKKSGRILKRLRNMLDGAVREMKALLEKSIIPDGALHHSMSTVDKSFECLIELVKEGRKPLLKITEFMKMIWSNVDGASERLVHLRWQCALGFGEVLFDIESAKQDARSRENYIQEEINNVLNSVSANVTTFGFVIPEMCSLAAAAMVYGQVFYYDASTYLRGYHIVPGVALRKKKEHVYIFLFLKIERGELDNFLRWPFNHLIKCRFVHESTGDEHVIMGKPPRNSPSFEKPDGGAKRKFVFPASVTFETLDVGGYVHNNELRVIWELL